MYTSRHKKLHLALLQTTATDKGEAASCCRQGIDLGLAHLGEVDITTVANGFVVMNRSRDIQRDYLPAPIVADL